MGPQLRNLYELIGRAKEVARVERALEDGAQLLTIVGTAGVGKTSVARAVYEDVRPRMIDAGARCAFVDLSDAATPASARAAIARALDVALQPEPAATPQLAAALAAGPTLLVLDNFEQLVASSAAGVQEWLDASPELQLLVTSRERLAIGSETIVELLPLGLPVHESDLEGSDAAALFLARWVRADPDAQPSHDDRVAIARVLHQLDGVPLAIELAAARCSLMRPTELAAQMDRRFELLRRTRPDGRARHTDLRAAIDASWELLSPDERAALARLSVFRGGFTIEAACALIAPLGAEPLDVLQALRDKSLVAREADGSRRLSLLLSIRCFAEERLLEQGATEADSAYDRHATWFADRVEPLDVFAETDNVRAAVERSLMPRRRTGPRLTLAMRLLVVLCRLERISDLRADLVEHLGTALAATRESQAPADLTCKLLVERATRTQQIGELTSAERDCKRALRLAGRAHLDRERAHVTRVLAAVRASQGRLDEALDLARQMRVAADRISDRLLLAWAEDEMALIHQRLGDQSLARTHAEQALAIAREVGDPVEIVPVLITLAFIHVDHGALDLARRRVAEAIELQERMAVRHSWRRLVLEFLAGRIEHAAGRHESACDRYARAETRAARLGDVRMGSFARAYVAMARFEQGRTHDAWALLTEVRSVWTQLGELQYGAFVCAAQGAIEAVLGNLDEARALIAQAERAVEGSTAGPLSAAVGGCAGILEACEASAARASGDATRALELEASARTRLEGVATQTLFEARLVTRWLDKALSSEGMTADERHRARITIALDGRWFEPEGAERVRCARRPVMRRMLEALARAYVERPGRALDASTLLAAGWPGERMAASAARRRLQVMISRMRELGLRGALQTTDDGYLLDTEADVRVATDQP